MPPHTNPFRNATGPRRLCPGCQRMVSTNGGRFAVHYTGTKQPCKGSDQLVPRSAAPDTSQAAT